MKYHARFYGRTLGAIGEFRTIDTETEGDTEEAATLALYQRFENVHHLRLTPIEEDAALERE